MQPLQWEHRPDGLRAPALICAFKGWNDAADAASSAIQYVGSALEASRFATIDPEEFYDFQATRPRVKMVDGQAREIVWPAVELYEARVPRAPRDLILLMTITGFGMMQQMAASNTILQTIAADDKRGRVMSFYTLAILGMNPIGSLLAGSVAAKIETCAVKFFEATSK